VTGTTPAMKPDRSSKRPRVLFEAVLLTPEGARQVRVRDLSQSGAQLLTDGLVKGECDALFKRGELFAAARILWSDDRQLGLRFYRQLSTEELASAFNGARGAHFQERSPAPQMEFAACS